MCPHLCYSILLTWPAQPDSMVIPGSQYSNFVFDILIVVISYKARGSKNVVVIIVAAMILLISNLDHSVD